MKASLRQFETFMKIRSDLTGLTSYSIKTKPTLIFKQTLNIYSQNTTARNSLVSIYLLRVSLSISSILSSSFWSIIHSRTSFSSSKLPKGIKTTNSAVKPFKPMYVFLLILIQNFGMAFYRTESITL